MDIVSVQLKQSGEALYLRLAGALEEKIGNGELREGEGLPPVRKLADHLKVSNSTVIAAYKYLEDSGLVYSKGGSGTYVLPQSRVTLEDDAGREALPQYDNLYIPEDAINLSGSTPGPDMFPASDFKAAVNMVLDTDGGNAFTYQESEGFGGLRAELAVYAGELMQTNKYGAQDIVITSGAQQALDLISKVLIRPGDVVLTENPTYLGAGSSFKARGAKVIGVPVERDGLNLDVLKYYVKRYQPRFLYTIPVYQTPTGVCLSPEKRKELLSLAERYGFYIIEEDIVSDLRLSGDKILPLKSEDAPGRVVYVKSLSKILMPGVRTGFIIAPGDISHAIAEAKYLTDISASGLIQRSLYRYFQSGAWRSHLDNIAGIYRERMEYVFKTLAGWVSKGVTFQKPSGGFGFWIGLPERIRDNELCGLCLNSGVLLAKGSTFYVSPMHEYDRHVRISYAVAGLNEIENGLGIVENCLNRLLERRTRLSTHPF